MFAILMPHVLYMRYIPSTCPIGISKDATSSKATAIGDHVENWVTFINTYQNAFVFVGRP